MDTPRLVEGSEDIALYYLIAHKTEISEQLVVMCLTIRQTLNMCQMRVKYNMD